MTRYSHQTSSFPFPLPPATSLMAAAYCCPTSRMGMMASSKSRTRALSLPYPLSDAPDPDGSLLLPLTDSDPIVGGPLPSSVVAERSVDADPRILRQSRAISGFVANRQAQTTAALISTDVQFDTATKSHVGSTELRRALIQMARRTEMMQTLCGTN